MAILKGLRSRYEEHHKVEITDDALEAAVKLSSRYINDRFLPDKAIDLIDEASSRVRLMNYTRPEKVRELEEQIEKLEDDKEAAIRDEAYEKAGEIKKKQEKLREKIRILLEKWQKDKETRKLTVSENEIADVVAGWTRIPVKKLAEEESERLKNLEGILHERVVGQEEAVTAVSKAIRRGRVGLKDPRRPIGSFLFLRPYRRRENRAFKGAGRGHVRHGKRPDPCRYVRIYGETQCIQDDRLPARLCRL